MSSLFLSVGDDPFAHLRQHIEPLDSPAFEGFWSSIEIQPNLFSPQRFPVGVVVADATGKWQFRILADGKKFDCVYGKAIAADIRSLLASAEQSLLRAVKQGATPDNINFDSSNIALTPPWPTSGASLEQVLSRLYSDVVAMEPSTEKPQRDFVSLDTEDVRLLVSNELKRISGLRHEQIVVQPNEVILQDDLSGESHALDFNLRTHLGAGSVLSAVYKTPSTIELNLLRASRDLAVYGRIKRVRDLGLFVMSASESAFEPSDYVRISNLLDEQSWRLERQGFRVVIFDSAPKIAESILEWADTT